LDLRKGFHEPVEKPRRFYKDVAVTEVEGGFGVLLDGRNLRTPKGRRTVLPTRAVAEQVAEEWSVQGETIEVATMHATRLANTALETIGGSREGVADEITQYAGSDLLCYFAEAPAELLRRQVQAWEPLLFRAEAEEGLRFTRCAGIVHRPQPASTLEGVRAIALELDDFSLAGMAFATALFGSAVLALAVLRGWISGEAAFSLSRLDETFQEEKWGVDAEAAERTARLAREAETLDRWFRALAR
jgi:chaperone required for assembly of F1-ATPase